MGNLRAFSISSLDSWLAILKTLFEAKNEGHLVKKYEQIFAEAIFL